MYRQILVNQDHQDFQRILWRFSPDDPIQDYRLKTVTYGISSAPYLAIRTLLQLANAEKSNFPLAAEIICNSTYIDDVVTTCPTLAQAQAVQSQLIALLAKGGFELRKWSSNHPPLLLSLPESHLSRNALSFETDVDNSLKILGLQWQPKSDCFSYVVEIIDRPCTKRNILSELARIFDPLGILSPVTFFTKHLIQHLWCLKLGWDEQPPSEVLSLWTQYKSELPLLSNLQLPRRIDVDEYDTCEVHCFGDASERGYAAVVYFRFVSNKSGQISTRFVCAKSKVAPLKRISIPRLELCASVLVANLYSYIVDVYKNYLYFDKVFAWTDSQIVLTWIKSSPHRWKTFVSNRVTFIQEKIPPDHWYYVPSEHNPADIASRGSLPTQLINNSLWWAGSDFLKERETAWDFSCHHEVDSTAFSEERHISLPAFAPSNFLDNLLENYSSLFAINRILAYILRFLYNIKHRLEPNLGSLTSLEIHNALLILVRHTQQLNFAEDILKLKQNLPPSKPFRKLNIFLDDSEILRVGGRLQYAKLSYDKKHPALLPRTSRLTHLIIENVHVKYFHVGIQTTQFLIAQQFWILSSKRAIRGVLSKCLPCWKTQPKPYQPPMMGNLPTARISQVKCFSHTGVDFAGPFSVTIGRIRGAKVHKAYVCLFICMATKALHIELVSDLSADAFLAAFRRFVARRGRCNHMYSDCGTNFVSAYKTLVTYMKDAASTEHVQWHFNPPAAAHFGGVWESQIKSLKTNLNRVVGQQILTYEELNTVVVQIEAILNSRPLTATSSDPNDLSALTPGHFLTLEPLNAPPDSDLTEVPLGRLTRWQLLQRMHQDFWRRWHKEYLNTLQQRSKWTTSTTSPIPGTLVLIKNELLPPLQWRLGRIVEVHPGADGVTRVATVRTTSGTYKRPLVKLCPLPSAS